MEEKEAIMAVLKDIKEYFEENLQAFFIPEKQKNGFCINIRNEFNLIIIITQYSLKAPLLGNWKYTISLIRREDLDILSQLDESDFEGPDLEILDPILKGLMEKKLMIINNSRRLGLLRK